MTGEDFGEASTVRVSTERSTELTPRAQPNRSVEPWLFATISLETEMKITSWPKMIFRRLPFWLAPIFLGLFACLPILSEPGVINTGDSAFLLVHLHHLVLNLLNGAFPVRWMPNAAYGLGYPFFNFYASLSYYVAAPSRHRPSG